MRLAKLIKLLALLGIVLIVGLLANTSTKAQEGRAIAICCAWDSHLADGELTYKISGASGDVLTTIREAVEKWDTAVSGLTLTEVFGKTKANVNIRFKQGGGLIAGQALRQFDPAGFIRSCDLNASGKAFGQSALATLGQVIKHEIGHCLGIDHANFDGDLMSPTVSGGSSSISNCDVEAVRAANHWKLVDGGNIPHPPHMDYVSCN